MLQLLLLLLVFPLVAFISGIHGSSFSGCNRSCGSNSVPYPFGFSQGCPIVLGCSSSSSSVQIGGFQVRNLTSESLLVDVPPSCNRSITATSVGAFFGQNYAMTWKNVLLVRGCGTTVPPALDKCVIPTALLSRRLDLSGCAAGGDNITCLSADWEKGFLNKSDVLSSGCGFLFTSIGYEESGEGEGAPTLVFRTAELGWWLDGDCRCSADATCTNLTSPTTRRGGFRCKCHDGFEGDGFADGRGCRKAIAPRCTPSNYVSGDCGGGSSRVALLVGGIVAGATVMAGLGLACFLIRRHSSSCRLRRSTQRLLSQASCTVPLYSYKDIDRATNGFSDSQRLGTGAYGTVYAGRLSNDTLVAVKKIKHRPDSYDGIEQVMNEVKLLSAVSHPNLVRLLGCCVERGEQILVYEFMPNGTLAQHLQRERGPPLPWTVRLTIAAETAKAIAYLHSSIHPPIYHRDIKSSNILLGYSFNSKVADFGLSRMGMTSESSHISTAPQGTPGYLDPQYHQNFHLSDKSDVYSFGVVLVEIITALKAVDFSRDQSEVNLAALAIEKIGKGCVDDIVDPSLDPNRDAWTLSSIHKVAELAFRCLAFHRDMRPSMMEVADELELIRFSGWAPPDDVFMSPAASSMCSSSGSTNIASSTDKSDRSKTESRRQGASVINKAVMSMAASQVKVDSPVSVVQDPWFSEQSSPSSNCLLANATH